MSTDDTLIRQALDKIEVTRKQRGISVRDAAAQVQHISEGYWRQFVAGGVKQSGIWVPKTPTPEQLVKMAAAVGIGDEIADTLGVAKPEPPSYDLDELQELRGQLNSILDRIEEIQRRR
ncbi:MAG TPA: hypothetical protein VG497_30615 [Kribbella sp.]|nr:hypothetical protein [Kribbella sp.]